MAKERPGYTPYKVRRELRMAAQTDEWAANEALKDAKIRNARDIERRILNEQGRLLKERCPPILDAEQMGKIRNMESGLESIWSGDVSSICCVEVR